MFALLTNKKNHFYLQDQDRNQINYLKKVRSEFIEMHFSKLLNVTSEVSILIKAKYNQKAKLSRLLSDYFTENLEIQKYLLEKKLNAAAKYLQE